MKRRLDFMYFDSTYIFIVLPAVLLSLLAQTMVSSTFRKYKKVLSRSGVTAERVVCDILRNNGINDVRVERVSGDLTDHYDPKSKVIRFSDSVYGSSSVAAIGVAAHEAGHAVQYAENYRPIKWRAAIIPITQFGSNAAPILLLLGLVFSFYPICYIGLVLFSAVVLFQLVTLPVEFNASRRALDTLNGGILTESETKGAAKVLRAAALTYVAALVVALANLLRYIVLAQGAKGNNKRR